MQRLATKNAIFHELTVLAASSEDTDLPVEALHDQQKQNFWRSKTGWTIIAGFNDRIDFDRAGVKVATINAGYYATPAAFAAAVVAALELADSTPVWACGYSSVTHKFTISTSAHNFALLFDTGVNFARQARLELGWDFTDTTPGLTATADFASYQSQHYIRATVPAGAKADAVLMISAVTEHNFSSDSQAHNVLVRFFSDSAFSVLTDTVDFSYANPDNAEGMRRVYFSDHAVDYIELLIQDTRNPDGFAELGMWWLGGYDSFESRLDRGVTDDPEDFSRVEQGPDGTLYVDFGRNRSRLGLVWRPLHGDDLENMRDRIRELAVGEAWLLDLDETSGTGVIGRPAAPLVFYGGFLERPREVTLARNSDAVEVIVIAYTFVVFL